MPRSPRRRSPAKTRSRQSPKSRRSVRRSPAQPRSRRPLRQSPKSRRSVRQPPRFSPTRSSRRSPRRRMGRYRGDDDNLTTSTGGVKPSTTEINMGDMLAGIRKVAEEEQDPPNARIRKARTRLPTEGGRDEQEETEILKMNSVFAPIPEDRSRSQSPTQSERRNNPTSHTRARRSE